MTSESDLKGRIGSFRHCIGIDFSGAASAGKEIWLAYYMKLARPD